MKANKLVNMLIAAVLLVSTVTVPVIGASAAATTPEETLEKIEALVLDEIAVEGQTEFFVWMVEKADLSPAGQLQTKQEKGRFVFNALVETAERTQKDLRAYLDAQGADYKAFYIANKILVYNGDQALVLDLAARVDVARITANHQFQLQEPFDKQPAPAGVAAVEPNITFINADDVWALGYDGAGTVMAGNDTGLDETHPAIAPHYRGCLDPPACSSWDHNYNWWDATGTYPTDPYDGYGHGTHTTGTMVGDDGGANQIGVAPGAQTVHCKNMTDGGGGNEGTFTECFQWDLAPWDLNGQNANPDLAPDAINNSWGWPLGGGDNAYRDEIQALHAAGILVEVSAGNEGSSCGSLRSPGDYWEVLTTGSVQHLSPYPGTITGFSSRGPSILDPGYYFPDIMAPGQGVRSCLPGNTYASWSGTSMAGPHATALVGLMWSACPSLQGRVEDTIQLIQDTAVPLTGQGGSNCGGDYTDGPNNDWGFGTIDAYAAVQAVLAQCTGLGALDGTVIDGVTMTPLEGATIAAEWDGGGQWGETTDATGYYTLTIPNGTYTVTADAFGYMGETVTGIVVSTDTVTTQDFDLSPATEYVISGTVTEAGTGTPLLAEVEVLDTPLSPVMTDPATGFYAISVPEGTYTFRVTAAQHQPEERVVVADHDQTQDFVLMQLPCILLVDDDNDNPDVLPYFSAALDNLGYDYDVFDVGGGGGDGPDLAGLEGYSMVLWFSGDKYGGSAGPNGTDEAALAAYLDGGGKLFLSSQDYLYDFELTPFGEDYLGIGSYSDDTGNASTKYGVAGDPIGDGLGPYPLTYPSGFTDYGDIVNAGAGASVAFRSSAGGGNNLDVDKDGGPWQTVFFGTSWVPVYNNNAANGEELLQRIIDWFGGCECQPVAGTALEWTPDTPAAGEAVTFTGTVAAGDLPVVYDWDFGDGEAGSGQSMAHTYTAEGDYTVTLTATNACGGEVVGDAITVLPPPCEPVEVLEVISTTAGCEASFAVELTGDAPYTYTWGFGAFGSSDEMTPTVDFGLSGTHPYTLTVLNCEGAYSATAAGEVTVECEPPCVAVESVTLTVITTDTLYPGDEALFSAAVLPGGASPPYTYTVDGGPETTATTQPLSFTLSFEQPGTHTVEIVVWNCEMTVPVTGTADVVVRESEEPILYIYLPIVVKD